jgi:hypothetical protein
MAQLGDVPRTTTETRRKGEMVIDIKPVGWAQKQPLLEYAPVWVTFADKPAPENGCEPVALYTKDQLEHAISQIGAGKSDA